MLAANPDVKAFYVQNDGMAFGVAAAIANAKKEITAGNLNATVSESPVTEGGAGVDAALWLIAGKEVPGWIHVPAFVADYATGIPSDGHDRSIAVNREHSEVIPRGRRTERCVIRASAQPPDHGTITIDGVRRTEYSPRRAPAEGVIIAQQEPVAVPQLTVERNLVLGCPLSVRQTAEDSIARALHDLNVMGFALDPKALIVTFNEPTTSMLKHNAEQVLNRVHEVAHDCRIAIIYVSHKMPEAMSVSDSVAVLRDSLVAFRSAIGDTTEGEIVRNMVGRKLLSFKRQHPLKEAAATVLSATGVTNPSGIGPIDLEKLLRAIVRVDQGSTGTVGINGKRRAIHNPQSARHSREAGIAFIPEERKRQGLLLQIPAYLNIAMTAGRDFNTFGILTSRRKQIVTAKRVAEEMSLRPRRREAQ
ncbi:hypothetical protein QBC34DRAFT_476669 [Podospora aff. communis PSN243]|uniref:Uncharacterized protein n=1 Tax=Podospora aff. communis PSN243 TaxID=3040156 RepID=A0AAV9G892_9PEZI|nr:hypothetical protein QBC34DRAFT_476669 [Podospora aff. communis PSN243]